MASTHDQNWSNSDKEDVFSIPEKLMPPFEFGFPEIDSYTYDDFSMSSYYHHNQNIMNGFEEALTLMDHFISKDPLYSSLDINVNNQYDLLNVYEIYNGFANYHYEDNKTVLMMNSSAADQNQQPLMINNTTTEDKNNVGDIEIINKKMMDNKDNIIINDNSKVEEMVAVSDSRLILEKVNRKLSGGCSSYTYTPSTKMMLSREVLSQYYYLPITQAAKELNVGLTLLKKRCRELGIARWPHRKLMSLKKLINNVQELGKEDSGEEAEEKLRKAVMLLEEERKKMEQVPDLKLQYNTKRLRQACFKANYKRRRTMVHVASSSSSASSLSVTGSQKSLSSCSSTCNIDDPAGFIYEVIDGDYGAEDYYKEQEEIK